MVFYVYSLRTQNDDREEVLICLTEKQNKFCKKKLIVEKQQTIDLVFFVGFNCEIDWNDFNTLDIIDRCVIDENDNLKTLINNTHFGKTSIKAIDILMKDGNKKK